MSAPPLSCGTPARWFCSQCGCWNHQDEEGRPLDVWERAMWDEHANHARFAAQEPADASPSVFCRTCRTHQTIVMNLLANYLTGDDETDAAQLAALPAYKRSVEQRYPIACAQCAERANAHIAAVNRNVQHQLLGSWVAPTHRPANQAQDADAFLARTRTWTWQRRHAIAVHAAGMGLAAAYLQPHRSVGIEGALAMLAAMPSTYDPAWRHAEALRMRNAHPILHGGTLWKVGPLLTQFTQATLWIVRCLLLTLISLGHMTPERGALFVGIQGCLLAYAHTRRRAEPPAPMRLVSREVHAQNAAPLYGDPLAGMSLGKTGTPSSSLEPLLEPVPTTGEAMEVEEDTPRPVHLGPRRLPDATSGLEELFRTSLALEPRGAPRHPWHWTTSSIPTAVGLLLLGVLLGLALVRT